MPGSDPAKNLERLLAKARRSRGAGFSLPIIEGYEEAAAMARDIAAKLATLPWDDRAVLISDVQLLEAALKTRAEVLRAGMASHAAEIVRLNHGAGARDAYGAGVRLSRSRPRGDR
jgi:hypothetical protein